MQKYITNKMIDIYQLFGGDVDEFARLGKSAQRLIIDNDDFFRIDDILHSLDMINKKLVSGLFEENVYQNLKSQCDNESIIDRLIKISIDRKS